MTDDVGAREAHKIATRRAIQNAADRLFDLFLEGSLTPAHLESLHRLTLDPEALWAAHRQKEGTHGDAPDRSPAQNGQAESAETRERRR